jgi:hypothetical protein
MQTPTSSEAETHTDEGRGGETKAEGATPTEEKAFINFKHEQTTTRSKPTIAKEAPCPLAQVRGRRTIRRWNTHPRARVTADGQAAGEEEILSTLPMGKTAIPKTTQSHPKNHAATTGCQGPEAPKAAPSRRKRRQSATTSLTDRPDVSLHLEPMVEGFDSQ